MKTSAKHFGLVVGPQAGQHERKWPQNYFSYNITHKKSKPSNQKIFFQVQYTRLANSFEPFNSSLAQSAEELGRW